MKTNLYSSQPSAAAASVKPRPNSKPLAKRLEQEDPFEKAIQDSFNKVLLEIHQQD